MKCENCNDVQECDKSHSNICKDFDLYGLKHPKPKKSKALCSFCHNNFYNNNRKNGCWSYKTAKVELKSYPNSSTDRPPWRLEWNLSCFIRSW